MQTIPLTERQAFVLSFLQRFISQHGYSPTLRQIGDSLGISSTTGVTQHLQALERKGHISRTPHAARSIKLSGYCRTTVRYAGEVR